MRTPNYRTLYGVVLLSSGFLGAWHGGLRYASMAGDNSCEESIGNLENQIERYRSYIDGTVIAQRQIGTQFPQVTVTDLGGRVFSTDFSNVKGALVLVFSPVDCSPCLTTQLNGLQVIHDSMPHDEPNRPAVLAICRPNPEITRRFVRALGLSYPVVSDQGDWLREARLTEVSPIVTLLNSGNTVIDCHVPRPGLPEASLLWFNQLRVSLREKLEVEADMNASSLGLGGTAWVDVIQGRFDRKNRNVHKMLGL